MQSMFVVLYTVGNWSNIDDKMVGNLKYTYLLYPIYSIYSGRVIIIMENRI